jgi:EVE domain
VAPIRSVTAEALGAWVIKCNPRKTPVDPMRAAGETKPIWCVADNYRSRLVRPGHCVLFWVTTHPQRGIWGAGRVTGEVTRKDGSLQVRVHIPLFGAPVTAAELLSIDGLGSMEVFRSPQQANPSWVSREEMAVLAPQLPWT